MSKPKSAVFEKQETVWFIDIDLHYPYYGFVILKTYYGENVSYEYGGSDEEPACRAIFLTGTA